MSRTQFWATGLLIAALLIAGCSPTATTQTTAVPAAASTTEPTAGGTPTGASSATTSATSAATSTAATPTAATSTTMPTASVVPTDTLQSAQLTINAAGAIEPSTISATAGVTLELTLLNRSAADALLVFDLAPGGMLGVPLPATVEVSSTATPVAVEPTAPLILAPTGQPTSAAATATGTLTTTSTPAPMPGAIRLLLRYDQPDTYQVGCAPIAAGPEAAGCSGSASIVVAAPGATPTETPVPLPATSTPELTGTATLTGTAVTTATSALPTTSATVPPETTATSALPTTTATTNTTP